MITFCSRQDVFYIATPKINRTVEQLQIMAETSSVSHPTSRKMTFCPAGGKKLCATNVMCHPFFSDGNFRPCMALHILGWQWVWPSKIGIQINLAGKTIQTTKNGNSYIHHIYMYRYVYIYIIIYILCKILIKKISTNTGVIDATTVIIKAYRFYMILHSTMIYRSIP
jgi:hypothetical protein